MFQLYEFLLGPGAWAAFGVFFIGLIARSAFLFGLSRERDKVFWNHLDWGWGLKSIFHWLLPLGSVSLRANPVFAVAFFVFHLCLLGVPIFLSAHNILFEETFGFSLPVLPDALAHWLALLVVLCGVFLFIRRLALPEVRILSGAWDYFLLLLTMSPFVSGWLAYEQIGDYQATMVLHLIFSEVLLVIIPFSKLGHLILFFFTRFFIGSEMGGRRQVEGRLGARVW